MASESISIQVVLALPDEQQLVEIDVPAGTTAREAVLLCGQNGLLSEGRGVDIVTVQLGVFGELVADTYVLEPLDRVELYRPLQQDPKELRRQRARSPGK